MVPATSPQSDTFPSASPDAARPVRRARLGDNPMQAVLGAAVVGLLIFSLTSNSNRIARLEDAINAGFAAQDAKFEDRFAKFEDRIDGLEDRIDGLEDRIDGLEDRIDDLDLKLTALIAALNKTDEVAAAIEGRLMAPGADESPP